jgi:hypothetical protein
MQLDSWWYSKSATRANGDQGSDFKVKELPRGEWNRYGGLLEYRAHKDLFPDGLAAFQKQLGLPLITHNRRIDRKSDYHRFYKITGVAAIDPKWWDDIADYVKDCGVATYEQDWLNEIYANSPEMASTAGIGDAFTDEMSRATTQRGITMQYCMATPRFFLQGSKYDNLTTIRVSDDRFDRRVWSDMLYVSRFASALGEWPWVDVFKSHETPNILLANLSGGMVGLSDALAETDVENVMRTCRGDGVIIKPDAPIVPTDATWIADAKAGSIKGGEEPMIAYAYTDDGNRSRTTYVFCYPRNERQQRRGVHFKAGDFGIDGNASVYEWKSGSLRDLRRGEEFAASFQGSAVPEEWAYFIVLPMSSATQPLLTSRAKFVTESRQLFEKTP